MLKRDEITDPNSCLNRAADDEPVFVLRAKDPMAAKTVRDWAAHSNIAGLHDDRVHAAFRFADSMEAWRLKNFPPQQAEQPTAATEEKKT